MGTEPQVIDTGNGLAPATLIVVTLTGISYVTPTMPEPTGIGLAGLALLSKLHTDPGNDTETAIASVEAELGTDRAWLEMLMKSFAGNGLIVAAEPSDDEPRPSQTPQPVVTDVELAVDRPYFLPTPLTFRVTDGGFTTFDWHGAELITLTAVELVAAVEFREPSLISEAQVRHQSAQGAHALSAAAFDQLLGRLIRARIVRPYDHDAPADIVALGIGRAFREVNDEQAVLRQSLRASIDQHEADEAKRSQESGVTRPRIVPVAHNGVVPPLALGLIFGYARNYEGGVLGEHYDFYPSWMLEDDRLERIAREPGVWLFSNYVWSFERCLAASARVKEINPHNITIHGGPSTPKYELDTREYFRRYPHVDITVRGEGEATTAEVLDRLRDADTGIATDLSVLREVAGISFRDGDRVTRTPDRDRIKDLDEIPSPYLNGMFDAYVGPGLSVTLETNRGCPYGCTFCDWGSATLSRIRKFDLDRVLGEFEWCSRNGIDSIGLADANFGIWSRDVEIVQHMIDLKEQYGSPKSFNTNLAKNTVKHTKRIIQMIIEAGITTQAYLAMQTMDAATLEAIDRSNISLEKYEELAAEFRKAGLPLIVDIMVGLPGQTVESFRDDLQECIDREVDVSLADTELLVNSPMNAPDYREKHKIEASSPTIGATRSLVVSTTTFTRAERELMNVTGKRFDFLEYLGVLRHVARFVRQEIDLREIDFYDRIAADTAADPNRWPAIAFALAHGPETPIAPASWRFFTDEVHDYLTNVLSMEDDTSLATALAVQHALLPDRMRAFPFTIELAHDYTAWHGRMIETKDSGHRSDWPSRVPRLREFGPAPFTITKGTIEIPGWRLHFEMDSAVSRNRSATSIDVLELVNTGA